MTKSLQKKHIKRALISVSNKTGIVAFAQGLAAKGIEIISTGGTAKLLTEHAIRVQEVSDYTGFPEMMDGRLKTLHPKIHGAILSRRHVDKAATQQHGICEIDLVVVNLYPFQEVIAKADTTLTQAIENIDIGGPTMLRAAAKNHQFVTVVVDNQDYSTVLAEINQMGGVSDEFRYSLAAKAFAHSAQYDGAIAQYLTQDKEGLPLYLNFSATKKQTMRYGENPHQKAAFYQHATTHQSSITSAHQLQGKALSFNNIVDSDAALECVRTLGKSACVIVKHANPCGVAEKSDVLSAYESAYRTDPTSAFGGVIAFNATVDAKTAQAMIERQFIEVLIAPDFDKEATIILSSKENIRLLVCGELTKRVPGFELKQVVDGVLLQQADLAELTKDDITVVTKTCPTTAQINDLLFAWRVAKYVKSNAIVYAKDTATIGIGAGQMSRVYSAQIASLKAADENLNVTGSVMASDAFFPFRDSIDTAAKAGIAAVIQPGGARRDDEVIAACDEAGIAMVFTAMRHFRH